MRYPLLQMKGGYKVAMATDDILSSGQIIEQIMHYGMTLTGADGACLATYGIGAGRLDEPVAVGLSDALVRDLGFNRGGPPDAAVRGGISIYGGESPGSRRALSACARDAGVRSFVCVPLMKVARPLGVACFYRFRSEPFDADDMELLGGFARFAAEALESAGRVGAGGRDGHGDALTGLAGRSAFERRLDDAWQRAREHRRDLAVLMLDVDNFQSLADSYGQRFADDMLVEVGRRLIQVCRQSDCPARYGEQGFAVLLPDTGGDGAKALACQLRSAVADWPFVLSGSATVTLTASVGVATYPACASRRQELVARAQRALHAAKRAGRNSEALYSDTFMAKFERNPTRLIALLNQSLDHVPAIIDILAAKVPDFGDHCAEVERLAVKLGERLGLDGETLGTLRWAARLHDVGIIYIPDEVLARPALFTDETEWTAIRHHAAAGAALLAQVPALADLAPIVRHHHEDVDGGGYPDGLKGEAIPYLARVLSVADGFVTATTDGPFQAGLEQQDALWSLRSKAGTKYDARLVAALCDLFAGGSGRERVEP